MGQSCVIMHFENRTARWSWLPSPCGCRVPRGVARAALEQIRAGRLVKGRELVPVYHRLSQAERERLERERQSRDNQNK